MSIGENDFTALYGLQQAQEKTDSLLEGSAVRTVWHSGRFGSFSPVAALSDAGAKLSGRTSSPAVITGRPAAAVLA